MPGKIFWVTGPPGAGKSTTCQLLARHHGYIYLEVDGFGFWFNPFPDLNAGNISVTAHKAKALKVTSDDKLFERKEYQWWWQGKSGSKA